MQKLQGRAQGERCAANLAEGAYGDSPLDTAQEPSPKPSRVAAAWPLS
jgi:hypothetical protein